MGEWLAVIGAALGIVYLVLKRRHKTPLQKAQEVVAKHRAKAARMKDLLQKRKLGELEEELDRQDRDLAAIRGVRPKADKAD